jgi:3-hydroxybutyryl-CoA dehydratase
VDTLQNYTYDEITIGQTASYSKTLSEDDLVMFAAVSGDVNPVHLDAEFAATTKFQERIGHGAWTGAIVSAALALELPGPGTIYMGQSLTFRKPVKIGDTVTIRLEVTQKRDDKKIVTLDCKAVNQHGKTVAKGVADVIAPSEKLSLPRPSLPNITIG